MAGRRRGRPRANGPEMAVTSVRYEKEKMKLLQNLGYTHSEAYAAGVEAIILSEVPRNQMNEEELEKELVDADQTIIKMAARKTMILSELKEIREINRQEKEASEAIDKEIEKISDLLIERKGDFQNQYAKLKLEYIKQFDTRNKLPITETLNFMRTVKKSEEIKAYVAFKLKSK